MLQISTKSIFIIIIIRHENWADNFDGMHKNNKESLFEIQFTGDRSGGQYEYNLFTVHLGPMAGLDAYEEAYPTDWMCQTLLADKTIDGKSSDHAVGSGQERKEKGGQVSYECDYLARHLSWRYSDQ